MIVAERESTCRSQGPFTRETGALLSGGYAYHATPSYCQVSPELLSVNCSLSLTV
jgi:hypothetical protein